MKLPDLLTKIATLGGLTVYTGYERMPTPEMPLYFVMQTEGNPILGVAKLSQVKLFCRDIMNRNLEDTTIHSQLTETDYSVMAIGIMRQYRAPFVVKITESSEGTDPDWVTSRAETLTTTEEAARKWAMTIYDYLYAWEIVCWRRIQDNNMVESAGLLGTPIETKTERGLFA